MLRQMWRNLRQQNRVDYLDRRVSDKDIFINNLVRLYDNYVTHCISLQRQKNRLLEKLERSEKQSDRRLVSCFKYQREIRELNKKRELKKAGEKNENSS